MPKAARSICAILRPAPFFARFAFPKRSTSTASRPNSEMESFAFKPQSRTFSRLQQSGRLPRGLPPGRAAKPRGAATDQAAFDFFLQRITGCDPGIEAAAQDEHAWISLAGEESMRKSMAMKRSGIAGLPLHGGRVPMPGALNRGLQPRSVEAQREPGCGRSVFDDKKKTSEQLRLFDRHRP